MSQNLEENLRFKEEYVFHIDLHCILREVFPGPLNTNIQNYFPLQNAKHLKLLSVNIFVIQMYQPPFNHYITIAYQEGIKPMLISWCSTEGNWFFLDKQVSTQMCAIVKIKGFSKTYHYNPH